MASPALSLVPSSQELREALHSVLMPLGGVQAAFVSLEPSSVRVDLIVDGLPSDLWGRLLEAERALDQRWPGLSFELLPHDRQGRPSDSLSFLGDHPLFQRPA